MRDLPIIKEIIANPLIISELGFHNISQILNQVTDIMMNENLLLELDEKDSNSEIVVIGDIHGNLESLFKILEIVKQKDPKFVIFLGDLVDRGPFQLECLILVLALKIRYPNQYFILKGNHETMEMNQYYGFYKVFMSKYNDQRKFREILDMYIVLPFCALVNNSILCLHGGIPEDIEILKKLEGLKPKDVASVFKSIAKGLTQIIWNDPKSELKGFSESFRGPGIKFFGEDVFERFIKEYDIKFVIRSHEIFPEGYRWFFHKRLLSIFSSSNYQGINPASYAIIKRDSITPKIVE